MTRCFIIYGRLSGRGRVLTGTRIVFATTPSRAPRKFVEVTFSVSRDRFNPVRPNTSSPRQHFNRLRDLYSYNLITRNESLRALWSEVFLILQSDGRGWKKACEACEAWKLLTSVHKIRTAELKTQSRKSGEMLVFSSHWCFQWLETSGMMKEHFRKNLVYGVRSTCVVINSVAMHILQSWKN